MSRIENVSLTVHVKTPFASSDAKMEPLQPSVATAFENLKSFVALAAFPLVSASKQCFRFVKSFFYYDYEDPAVLSKLRQEASQIPLTKIVEKHGWEKLFRYELLSPEQFSVVFRAHADVSSFRTILEDVRKAKEALSTAASLKQFALPSPTEWKSKFETETAHLRCDQIVEIYSLADLKTYAIVSEHQMKVLEEVSQVLSIFHSKNGELERQFDLETAEARSRLQEAEQLAYLTYNSHPSRLLSSQIEAEGQCRILQIRNRIRDLIREEARAMSQLEHAMHHCIDPLHSLALRRCEMETKIHRLKQERNRAICEIQQQMAIQKMPLFCSDQAALALRDTQIGAARREFHRIADPVRQKIEALKAENKASLDAKATECQTRYLQKTHP